MSESTVKDLSGRWKVVTHQLLQEVLDGNPTAWALATPIRIFGEKLYQVAEQAQRINDPMLNALMIELALYENANPYSERADIDVCREYADKAFNGEMKLINERVTELETQLKLAKFGLEEISNSKGQVSDTLRSQSKATLKKIEELNQ